LFNWVYSDRPIITGQLRPCGSTIAARVTALAREYGLGSRLIFTGDLNPEDLDAFPERPDAFWNIAPEDSTESL
jgi:hypothetical protein